MSDYLEFLRRKTQIAAAKVGDQPAEMLVSPILKPHQAAIVRWMVEGGRRACFASFGLGKTVIQLEAVRIVREREGGKGLIIMPLGVRDEFMHDAAMLETTVKFIRRIEEATDPEGIYLTNYETIRDGKIDPLNFTVCSLDEAACLRGFGGTKTFREFMAKLAGDDRSGVITRGIPFRFVATATPSPNEYIELLCYAAYLGIMDVSQAKTRFFKRDSTKADKLTIHPHKEREFWLWVASWGLFLQKPSDLGFSDDGYEMPRLNVHWHQVKTDHTNAGVEKWGQVRLLANSSLGVSEAAREKKASLPARLEKTMEILSGRTERQGIVWCSLDVEQDAIEKAAKEAGVSFSSLYGKHDIDLRDKEMRRWKAGETELFISKPMMYGAGANLQTCHTMIFMGIGFKFYEFIQALHRIYRFLQVHDCEVHMIYTEAEAEVKEALQDKWERHNKQVEIMSEIIKKYGLSSESLANALTRSMGVERVEVSGENYRLVNNDCVLEMRRMDDNSVGLILTSVPFSTQYEYSPNYADFGHTNSNEHFFEQMDFLTPELLRVLQPGRIAAIHVKDRIIPGGLTGLGFQTVYPFHARCIEHYTRHGFAYMGMKTIVTDVVRENNQTYRLGWTEQCKDGTKMGVGMPEYLLLFRKPPTNTENSYADLPVVKHKGRYTRARWQIDAHGFTRSSGDRLLNTEELRSLTHDQIFKIFRDYSLSEVYNFEHHVKIGEVLDARGMLPVTFMLLQPQSWSPDVWTDITRMLTLNGSQSSRGKEMHLCPMQFDLADRVIEQFSMEGEVVLDPFGGLMTVPYRAILKGRFGIGIELSGTYFLDGAAYCRAAEQRVSMPSLFDIIEGSSKEPGRDETRIDVYENTVPMFHEATA